MSEVPLLELRDVAKKYGGRMVVDRVCLAVQQSEMLGIIGPNGAGKTTLLRILVGLVRPTRGVVLVRGRPVHQRSERIPLAYFAGASTLPPAPRASQWARLFGPTSVLGSETRRVRHLSRGTRQKVGLGTMLSRPEQALIVLDEPWEGLDPMSAEWLVETLRTRRKAGSGVVVSSHRLHDLAGLCDHYGFLVDGALRCFSAEAFCSEHRVTAGMLMSALERITERRS